MSQNVWATIMPFGPVTLIFYWPKFFFSGQSKADPHFRHCKVFLLYELFIGSMHNLQLLNYFYINVVKYNQISCIKISLKYFKQLLCINHRIMAQVCPPWYNYHIFIINKYILFCKLSYITRL